MKPLKQKGTEGCCAYICVIVGHFFDPIEQVRKFWEIPDSLVPVTPGQSRFWGIHQTEDRSLLRHMVALGLFESGGEVRRNRPDLAQSFGPEDRGPFWTVVGRTLVEFIVGFESVEARDTAEEFCEWLGKGSPIHNPKEMLDISEPECDTENMETKPVEPVKVVEIDVCPDCSNEVLCWSDGTKTHQCSGYGEE